MIAQSANTINKRILRIAIPSIISNITVPLLGLIDVTIVGHLGAASVIGEAGNYFYWVLAIPLAGFAAFLWDGVFIGATATRQMFYSMLVASGSFFLVYYSLHPWMGNHALWLAFIIYLSLRGIVQTALSRKILR